MYQATLLTPSTVFHPSANLVNNLRGTARTVIDKTFSTHVLFDACKAADATIDEMLDEGKAADEGDVAVLGH